MRHIILLCCWLALSVASAHATAYHIATTGNDTTGDGSSGTPWLTLSKGLSSVAAGDTLHLAAGTYPGTSSTSTHGTAQSPITISGAGIGSTIITGETDITHDFYILSGITFDGNRLDLFGENGTVMACEFLHSLQGIRLDVTSANWAIQQSLFHFGMNDGLLSLSGSTHLVLNNTFEDPSGYDAVRIFGGPHTLRGNLFQRINTPNDAAYITTSTTSLTLSTGSKTLTVDASKSLRVGEYVRITSGTNNTENMKGFITAYSGTSMTINVTSVVGSGSDTSWTVAMNAYGNPYDQGAEAANHVDSLQSFWSAGTDGASYATNGLVFEQNIVKDSTGQFGNLENNAANTQHCCWTFRNNLFINSRTQINIYIPTVVLYHNTVYGFAGDGTTGFRGANSGGTKGNGDPLLVTNNAFIRSSSTESTGVYSGATADYNLITDTDDTAKTGYSEANGINGGYSPAQIFTNAGSNDFTLVSDSPALNAGTDLSAAGVTDDFDGTSRPQGAGWDIGAFELSVEAEPVVALTGRATLSGRATIGP